MEIMNFIALYLQDSQKGVHMPRDKATIKRLKMYKEGGRSMRYVAHHTLALSPGFLETALLKGQHKLYDHGLEVLPCT